MGVTYLLDTHAVVWLVDPRYQVPPHVRRVLGRIETPLLVSSVTPFEISTKVRLGKFSEAGWLLEHWDASMSGLAATPLPVSHAHGIRAGDLDWDHRDPFDRLLAGQALAEDLTFVTADPAFDSAPGLDLLRW